MGGPKAWHLQDCARKKSLQKPPTSDHGDQPFKEPLGLGLLGASRRSQCPRAQHHRFQVQASKAGFRARTHQVVRFLFLVYLQKVALKDQLLEKTFRDLQQKPLSLRGVSKQKERAKTKGYRGCLLNPIASEKYRAKLHPALGRSEPPLSPQESGISGERCALGYTAVTSLCNPGGVSFESSSASA